MRHPVFDLMSSQNRALYRAAKRFRRTMIFLMGASFVIQANAGVLAGRAVSERLWIYVGIDVVIFIMALVTILLSLRAIDFCNRAIDQATLLNVVCRRDLPDGFNLQVLSNPTLCACTHPDIVCHVRDTGQIPVVGGVL